MKFFLVSRNSIGVSIVFSLAEGVVGGLKDGKVVECPDLSHLESRKLELKEFGLIEPVAHMEFRLSVLLSPCTASGHT